MGKHLNTAVLLFFFGTLSFSFSSRVFADDEPGYIVLHSSRLADTLHILATLDSSTAKERTKFFTVVPKGEVTYEGISIILDPTLVDIVLKIEKNRYCCIGYGHKISFEHFLNRHNPNLGFLLLNPKPQALIDRLNKQGLDTAKKMKDDLRSIASAWIEEEKKKTSVKLTTLENLQYQDQGTQYESEELGELELPFDNEALALPEDPQFEKLSLPEFKKREFTRSPSKIHDTLKLVLNMNFFDSQLINYAELPHLERVSQEFYTEMHRHLIEAPARLLISCWDEIRNSDEDYDRKFLVEIEKELFRDGKIFDSFFDFLKTKYPDLLPYI